MILSISCSFIVFRFPVVAPFICYFMLLVDGRSLVKLLLHAGADPSAQDAQHGRTALHTAAMANDVELVKVL